jgi:integrase/recombinase XerD
MRFIIAFLYASSVLSLKEIPMRISKVSLYVREHSSRKYVKANKKFYAPGTIFVLRYDGRWETVGEVSLADAQRARLKREVSLLEGWKPDPQPKPKTTVWMLDAAMDQYLGEIKNGRKKKTHQAYSVALRYFYQCAGNKAMSDINRGDLLKFAMFLREQKEQSPRSAYNKFENLMTFLKHHDITGKSLKIKAPDWPQYTEEEPEIYEQENLDKFFTACDDDERLLFEFFLMTGMREQEVIYATDRSVNFENNHIYVKHNPKFGCTPKMYKERSIPVPKALIDKLKKMLVNRGKGGLLFPTASGNPKFDFLDMAKAIARRAGIDESDVWLHKFRATFCTRSLWANVALPTVQEWMGHTDVASTMRYMRAQRGVKVQQMVEAIWA